MSISRGTASIQNATARNNPSKLIAEVEEGAKFNKTLHHSSVFGSDAALCSKKSAIHRGISPNETAGESTATRFYFAVGEAIHGAIDDAIKNYSVATELQIRHPIGISGRLDNVVLEGGRLKIVDTKTCGKLPTKAKPTQKEQVMAYALISGITSGSILYVSRNVADWRGNLLCTEIKIDISKEELEVAARTMAESVVFVKNKVIPTWRPEYRKTKVGCGWCPFIKNCHEGEDFDYEIDEDWSFVDDSEELEGQIEALKGKLLADMPNRYQETIKLIKSKGTKYGKKMLNAGKIPQNP